MSTPLTKPEMHIELRPARLKALRAERHEQILPVPDHFRDEGMAVRADHRYSLAPGDTAEVRGVASFENRRMRIRMRAPRGPWPTIGARGRNLPLFAEHCVRGAHNIQLGDVKIIEHVLAMCSALNLELDFLLDQHSFPTFNECNRPFLDALQGRLVDQGPVRRFTVKRPVAGIFERGYFMLEPAEHANQPALVMDHQISYPGDAIGNQRIVAEITPEFFSFITSARTTSFRPETKRIYWLTRLGIARLKYPVTTRNILFADAEKIYNPRPRFATADANYEFICHELIDVMAWLRFLEVQYAGKFVGRLTTHFFDHHRQIDAAQWVCHSPEFEKKVGVAWL